MVRVVDCHAGVLGSNPGGPKIFSLWNYYITNVKFKCQSVLSPTLELYDWFNVDDSSESDIFSSKS